MSGLSPLQCATRARKMVRDDLLLYLTPSGLPRSHRLACWKTATDLPIGHSMSPGVQSWMASGTHAHSCVEVGMV